MLRKWFRPTYSRRADFLNYSATAPTGITTEEFSCNKRALPPAVIKRTQILVASPSLLKVLVIEDEPDVVEMLTRQLAKAGGYKTLTAIDGESGIACARSELPAVIVLDLMLPKMSGLDVCRVLKNDAMTRGIPIIMLTAKAEEIDRIVGLEFGADDYVAKPFSPREVVLRIGAILRRGSGAAAEKMVSAEDIVVNTERHEVRINGKPLDLTAIEFKLLSTLMQRRGRLQSRDRLLNDVWGYEAAIDTRTVDTHVRRLREKLGKRGEMIETVRGFGYRFRAA